ncbi:DNA repair protein RecN [soil metagenome]
MLQQLHIQNYAIIDQIKINFSKHLNVITGETGAGKSILMGALSLILGERADTNVLLDKQKKCFIEGTFNNGQKPVKNFLKLHDLDEDNEIVIRREIAPNGKSRAFINDTPISLNLLKELTSMLVDLHRQFDTLELGDSDFQREVIDSLADNTTTLIKYRQLFQLYTTALVDLQQLKEQQANSNKELDYHQFLFDELGEANFAENELEDADQRLKLMSDAENIKATITKVYAELQQGEQPIVQQLKIICNQLQSLKSFTAITALIDRLQAVQIELKDIAGELDSLNDSVSHDPEKINLLNERIALGYKLLKKHNASNTHELLLIKDELKKKLDLVINLSELISQKQTAADKIYNEANAAAATLSVNRKKQAKPFEQKVNKLLAQVGMPNAAIKVEVSDTEHLNGIGKNTIEFLFDANVTSKSARFEPLKKVASGGELSRLMLSIKSLVAKSIQLPTLIFDEIDTGISGEAARQVGFIMSELAAQHQLITITHQPQIAAKASAHYFVYKDIVEDRIVTSVKLLNTDERITAIAKMLSGEKPSAAAFKNAKEMMGN